VSKFLGGIDIMLKYYNAFGYNVRKTTEKLSYIATLPPKGQTQAVVPHGHRLSTPAK